MPAHLHGVEGPARDRMGNREVPGEAGLHQLSVTSSRDEGRKAESPGQLMHQLCLSHSRRDNCGKREGRALAKLVRRAVCELGHRYPTVALAVSPGVYSHCVPVPPTAACRSAGTCGLCPAFAPWPGPPHRSRQLPTGRSRCAARSCPHRAGAESPEPRGVPGAPRSAARPALSHPAVTPGGASAGGAGPASPSRIPHPASRIPHPASPSRIPHLASPSRIPIPHPASRIPLSPCPGRGPTGRP